MALKQEVVDKLRYLVYHFSGKKAVAALVGVALVVLNKKFNLELSVEDIVMCETVILGLIVSWSYEKGVKAASTTPDTSVQVDKVENVNL